MNAFKYSCYFKSHFFTRLIFFFPGVTIASHNLSSDFSTIIILNSAGRIIIFFLCEINTCLGLESEYLAQLKGDRTSLNSITESLNVKGEALISYFLTVHKAYKSKYMRALCDCG